MNKTYAIVKNGLLTRQPNEGLIGGNRASFGPPRYMEESMERERLQNYVGMGWLRGGVHWYRGLPARRATQQHNPAVPAGPGPPSNKASYALMFFAVTA